MKEWMTLVGFTSLLALVALGGAGCNGGSSTPGTCTNCSDITPDSFVAALVSLAKSGQIAPAYANSTVAKETSLQPGYFIIWDGQTQSYEAVSINTTPNIINTTESSACSENGATCSNLSPAAAAQAFAGATGENHTTVVAEPTGSVSIVNGTQFGATFGQETFPDPYDNTETVNNVGSLNYFPVTPTNSVTAPTGGQVYQDGYNDNLLYSQPGQTKDVMLQQAQVQNTAFYQQAAQISSTFQMDFQSAIQITQLAGRIQTLQSAANQLSDADRAAITATLLGIAGVTQAEVDQAFQSTDKTQAGALVDKISLNLGMPQSMLRDQILPKLGVNLN